MQKLTLRSGGNTPVPGGANTPGATPAPGTATGGQSGSIPPVSGGKLPTGSVSLDDALKGTENAASNILGGSGGTLSQPGQAGSPTAVSMGGLMDGMLTVNLIDSFLPSLLVLILYRLGMQLKKTDLQLTEKEKTTLAPIVQKCLDILMINFNNPWVALSFTSIVIYGSKIVEKGGIKWLDNKTEELKKKQEQAVKAQAEKDSKQNPPGAEGIKPDQQINPPGWKPTKEQIQLLRRKKKTSLAVAEAMLIKRHAEGKPLFD